VAEVAIARTWDVIIITTGDCGKAVDKIPEIHGMRSIENGKQTDDDWVGHVTVMRHRLGRGSTGGCRTNVR
jgi:hypothetical protein